jgi:hypothetical protein
MQAAAVQLDQICRCAAPATLNFSVQQSYVIGGIIQHFIHAKIPD